MLSLNDTRILLYGLLILLSPVIVLSQGFAPISTVNKIDNKHIPPTILDISLLLREKESYQNIKLKTERLKNRRKNKKGKSVALGDVHTFFVRNIFTLDTWDRIAAECIYKSDKAAIWISVYDKSYFADSLNINAVIDSLSYYLEIKPNSNLVNSTKGIINLNTEYFGSMPDVDGDGILDILLLDIDDDFLNTGSFIAGFFDPVDLIEHEFSNKRDLIYIDIFPTLYYRNKTTVQRAASTIAHELQHLIHANYETESRQYTFINEALSEYAEVLNGFSPRNPAPYFKQPNRALFSWNHNDPIPDYVRGSLFLTYLFEQLGADKAKYLVQDRTDIGYKSISDLIKEHSNLTFQEIFKNWGLSLLGVKDGGLGFTHPHLHLQNIQPTSAQFISDYPSVSTIVSAPLSHSFFYSTLTNKLELLSNQRIEASAWADYPSKVLSSVQVNAYIFEATAAPHGSLRLLLSNTEVQYSEPDTTSSVQSVLFVGEKSGQIKPVFYDDGIPDPFLGNASFLQLTNHDTEVAILFSSTQPYWLSEISVKAIFKSELSGSGISATSAREISIQVYSVKNKVPDLPLTPAFIHSFSRPFGNLKFERISLAPFYEQLSALKDSVAIVIKNGANNENFVALGMDYSRENHTKMKNSNGSWTGFENVEIGSANLWGWNPMVRATSIINVTEQDNIKPDIHLTDSKLQVEFMISEELDSVLSRSATLSPSGLVIEGTPNYSNSQFGEARYSFPIQVGGPYTIISSLTGITGTKYESREQWQVPESADFRVGHNYPNPFNPSTTVPFLLLEDGRVAITIYDVIGRKVLHVPEQFYAAGNQNVRIDFAGLASGMYILKMDVNRSDNGRNRGEITRIRKITFMK